MHAFFFDIDGTLLNTGGAGKTAMEATIAAEFNSSRSITGIPYAGRTDRAIVSELFDYFEVEITADAWERFRTRYVSHLPTALAECDGRVLPGVVRLLDALSARDDVLLGLLTGNFEQGAWAKLEHYGLAGYFNSKSLPGGFGDHHRNRNDVAATAIEMLKAHSGAKVDVERVWVIGDTPSDVRCGKHIRAKTVAVATGAFPLEQLIAEQPDHVFEDLSNAATASWIPPAER